MGSSYSVYSMVAENGDSSVGPSMHLALKINILPIISASPLISDQHGSGGPSMAHTLKVNTLPNISASL